MNFYQFFMNGFERPTEPKTPTSSELRWCNEEEKKKVWEEYEESMKAYRESLVEYEATARKAKKKSVSVITVIVIIALLIFMSFFSLTKVPAGHTGVITTFGKVSESVIDEGIHIKAPWQRITKVDNRIVKLEVETEAFSKDLQTVSTVTAVNYRIDNTKSYYIIKNIGKDYETVLITPTVNEVLKAVTAKYTAEEMVANRNIVSTELVEGLNEKLNTKGFYVEAINIVNFDFTDDYIKAIEAKQVAEQQLKKAETDKKTAVVNAQADAEKKVIAAQAEADAIKAKAEAQAQANAKLNKSITKNLIDYEIASKWNGEVPKVSGSSGTLIDFSNIDGDKN